MLKTRVIRLITVDQCLIASAQVLGFLSFYYVMKDATADIIKLMSIYMSFQAASAFLTLSIQYSRNRMSVLSGKFMVFLPLYYILICKIYVQTSAEDFVIIIIIASIFCSVTFMQLFVTALGKYRELLIIQNVIAPLLPLALMHPYELLILMCILLIAVSKWLKISKNIKRDNFLIADVKEWMLSLCMQAPFVVYAFFDPSLANRIGMEIYGQYIIYVKFIFGVSNFIFSFLQFKLIRGDHLNVSSLPLLIIITMIFLLLFGQLNFPLYAHVTLLAVIINFGSLYIRSMLVHCTLFDIFLSILGIVVYFIGLIFLPNDFFTSEKYFYVAFLSICVCLSVFSIRLTKMFNQKSIRD